MKLDSIKNNALKKNVLTAIFAAIIAVTTAFIKIPTGINGGYVHVGDSMIYLAGCLLGPYAAIWAIPTAIIKPINSLPFIIATAYYVKKKGYHKIIHPSTILMTVVSGLITIFGYYIAEGIMFSFDAALLTSALGLIQPIGSAVVFIIIGFALDKIKIQKYF